MPVFESFEDDNAWGLLETDTAPDVASQGLVWGSLGGGITLINSAARTGDWALRSDPPGAPSDGVIGTGRQAVFGIGGWIRAPEGSVHDIYLFLNDETTDVLDASNVGSVHEFFGVIDTDGIANFEFSTEAVPQFDPPKVIYLDDFTVGFASSPSLREPGTHWTNPAGGNYAAGTNWAGGAAPIAPGNALHHLGSAGAYTVAFLQNEAAGQLVVANDTVADGLGGFQYGLSASNITRESLIVGELFGDTGTLTLTDGTVSGVNAVVAHSTGTTAHLTVDAGATLDLTAAMRVGSGGNGTLDIVNGGTVSSGKGVIGQLNGDGTVNVSGSGSLWSIPFPGQLDVGMGGATGVMNVSSGGVVTAHDTTLSRTAGNGLANEPAGLGSINVSGANSAVNLSGTITVGQDYTASLNITNGGQLTTTGDVVLGVAAEGPVLVDGVDSQMILKHSSSTVESALVVGRGDSLRLPDESNVHTTVVTIQNGGLLECEETSIGGSSINNNRNGDGIVNCIGVGSIWRSGNDFSDGWTYIGYKANATVNVQAGAVVETGGVIIGRFTFVSAADGTGTRGIVNVDGAGSTWTTAGEMGFSTLYVGYPNDPQPFFHNLTQTEGQLHVSDGGSLAAFALVLAERKKAKGVVTIDGIGSVINAGFVRFGPFNGGWITDTWDSSAHMTISNGGQLNVTNDAEIHHGTVDLIGGTVSAANLLVYGGHIIPPTDPLDIGDTSASLVGEGHVNGNVNNVSGVVAPGHALPGVLTVDGNYTQEVDAALVIDLAGTVPGTEFDRVDITGTASLAGTLKLVNAPGFSVSPGQSFDVLSAAAIVDAGLSVSSDEGLSHSIVPDGAGVVLRVSLEGGAPVPAVSGWALVVLTGLLAIAGTLIIGRQARSPIAPA